MVVNQFAELGSTSSMAVETRELGLINRIAVLAYTAMYGIRV